MSKLFDSLIYSVRWLLSPIYLGLGLVLVALVIEFYQGVFHLLCNVIEMSENDVTLKALSLIDVALVGGLIIMVMYAGYENFVSTLDIAEGTEKLSWLGTMDSSSLKAKVAAAIVAISSIHLLKVFMDASSVKDGMLMWYMLLHLTFVISAFAMGYLDTIAKSNK
ncbi:MAG: TIGR00645 family protein [Candidatus Endonucleobacter sp. (ex Gigantidas childressi)]|nr:TIGR00645 family protein [Candidatus Endonucleobacter sp. (ex Gigantidas childressi)]